MGGSCNSLGGEVVAWGVGLYGVSVVYCSGEERGTLRGLGGVGRDGWKGSFPRGSAVDIVVRQLGRILEKGGRVGAGE